MPRSCCPPWHSGRRSPYGGRGRGGGSGRFLGGSFVWWEQLQSDRNFLNYKIYFQIILRAGLLARLGFRPHLAGFLLAEGIGFEHSLDRADDFGGGLAVGYFGVVFGEHWCGGNKDTVAQPDQSTRTFLTFFVAVLPSERRSRKAHPLG